MNMKKLLKVLALTTMCLGMPVLNACSFFRSNNDDVVGIKNIEVNQDDEGNALITINFTDKSRAPVTFTLPKGTDGKEGVGIKKVDYKQDEYGVTTVTITFTGGLDPVSFTLAPGKSISDVKFDTDAEENTLIIFVDSDGNELSPITVFKGDTGETGTGIVSIIADPHTDGSTTLNILMSDQTTYDVEIPAPREGRGIQSIVTRKEGTSVYLVITYTDDTVDEISFESTPSWTTGNSKPGDSFGYNGDYYFDISHDIIYIKENGVWNVAVDFNTNAAEYSVIFDLNDTTAEPAEFAVGQRSYVVRKGETFYSAGLDVPVPTRAGYTFNGWYTSTAPNVTHGVFNNLTPVLSDMTLYASWSK